MNQEVGHLFMTEVIGMHSATKYWPLYDYLNRAGLNYIPNYMNPEGQPGF